MELDEVADELYEVPPEEFVALRTTRQDEARAEGDKGLAKEIGTLTKPSAAAWACNLLVREHRAEIEDLVELGDLLREAQENLAGDQLRALDVQRRRLVTALTRQARGLAAARGHPVSTAVATQVEQTLRASLADPDAGRALLTGRLTSPMSYSGLGVAVSARDLRLVHPSPGGPPTRRAGLPAAEKTAAEEERRREIAAAQDAVARAGAEAGEAAAALARQRIRAGELAARRAELLAHVHRLADQLSDAEREAGAAGAALEREERRQTAAERAAAEAADAWARTRARLASLTGEH